MSGTDPERLADLRHGRLQVSRARLVEALHGRVTAHMIQVHLTQIAALETAVADLQARIGEAPCAPSRRRQPQ